MSADELRALAERVMALTGACRETDAEITVVALGWFTIPPRYDGDEMGYGYIDNDGVQVRPGHGGRQMVKPFTASLDAAMTLVPEGMAGCVWFGDPNCLDSAAVGPNPPSGELMEERYAADAATPALALTAAALLARAEQENQK